MLVHAVRLLGFGSTVLKSDRAAYHRFGAQAGENKRQHRGDRARKETACDQTLLHAAGSVAGKAEEVPRVVHELVHM